MYWRDRLFLMSSTLEYVIDKYRRVLQGEALRVSGRLCGDCSDQPFATGYCGAAIRAVAFDCGWESGRSPFVAKAPSRFFFVRAGPSTNWGTMYLCYVDESGDTGPRGSRHLLLGAAVLFEGRWSSVSNDFADVIGRYFPVMPRPREIHCADVRGGRDDFVDGP
jgi:hypothetical protein